VGGGDAPAGQGVTLEYAPTTTLPRAQVFDRAAGNKLVGTVAGLSRGVFSVDMAGSSMLALAGGDCAVRVFQVRACVRGMRRREGWLCMQLHMREGAFVRPRSRAHALVCLLVSLLRGW
jgi:hypothetical protein